MNRLEAIKQGFIVDTCCYPWFAYKGNRFNPTESRTVHTDLEAWLLKRTGRLAREFPGDRISALASLKPLTKFTASFIVWMEEVAKVVTTPEHLELYQDCYNDGFTPAEALWERL